MSHSRIFDEYAKIMSEKGLLKTADKKDSDYNVTPDKAGPDTKVEETGYELVEIAHPEQVQVAESRLNDGIVENGVEQQKVMIDVALRNPRGVLASSLMRTLVKAATLLDADMNAESIRMASEIDIIIKKLAEQSPTFPIKAFNDLVNSAITAAEAIKKFDFEGFFHKYLWFKSDATKRALDFSAQIWEYKTAADSAVEDSEKIKVAQDLAQFALQQVPQFRKLFQMEGEEWWESNRNAAWAALNEFERQAKWWLGKVVPALDKPVVSPEKGPGAAKPVGEYNIPTGMVPMQGKPAAGEVRVIDHPEIQWDGNQWVPNSPNPDAQIIGMPGTKMEKAKWDKRLGLWLVPAASAAPEQMSGVSSKAPRRGGGGFSARGPEVEELQRLLGGALDVDGKFGPLTWGAVTQKATENSLLNDLIKGKPELAKSYQAWKIPDVASAIQRIQQGKASVNKAVAPKQ